MEITTIFHVIFMKNIKYKPWAIDGKLANLSTYRIGIWYSGVLITITRQRFIRSCINACAFIHDYAKKETIIVRSHPSYRFLAFTSSFLEGSFRLRLDNVKKKRKTMNNELVHVRQKPRAEWEKRDDSVFRSTSVVSALTNASIIQGNWTKLFLTLFHHEKFVTSYYEYQAKTLLWSKCPTPRQIVLFPEILNLFNEIKLHYLIKGYYNIKI